MKVLHCFFLVQLVTTATTQEGMGLKLGGVDTLNGTSSWTGGTCNRN